MKKLSPKQLLKLKLAKPDIADFILRMQENENEEKISSVMMRKTEEDTDSFRKIKTIVGRDGAGIAEIDLVGYELVVTLDNGVQKTLGNIRGPAGKDGYKPSRDELLELIKPLIPRVSNGVNGKDGKTPTDKQLLSLIKPLIPKPIEGKPGESGKKGKDGSPDTGSQIIDKINKVPKDGPKIKAIHIEDFKVEGKKIFEEQYIHRGGQRLRVRELDGTPNIADVREIRVTNGSITNLGNGIIEISVSGVVYQLKHQRVQ